jgi:hypothetical protein
MDVPTRQPQGEPPGQIDFYIGNALYHLGRPRRSRSRPGKRACARTTRSFPPTRTSPSATGSRDVSATPAGRSPRRRSAGCARAPTCARTSSAAPR